MEAEEGECFEYLAERGTCANDALQKQYLEASGLHIVIAQALYAIMGAVALQRGGVVANNTVRERVLGPLGID